MNILYVLSIKQLLKINGYSYHYDQCYLTAGFRAIRFLWWRFLGQFFFGSTFLKISFTGSL